MKEIKDRHINIILVELKNLQNVATIMDMYFKPLNDTMEKYKYTPDEAIKTKEIQLNYLTKYGTTILKKTIKDIENIINGTYENIQQTNLKKYEV